MPPAGPFFLFLLPDAELQWKTDNLCGLISVMLRDRPCQAVFCQTSPVIAQICVRFFYQRSLRDATLPAIGEGKGSCLLPRGLL